MVFTVKHHDSGIPTQPDNERPRNGGVSRASTSWSADYRVKVRLQTEEFASAKWRPTFCVSAWRTLASFSRVVVAQRCVSLGQESKPHQATTGSRPESVCREETKLELDLSFARPQPSVATPPTSIQGGQVGLFLPHHRLSTSSLDSLGTSTLWPVGSNIPITAIFVDCSSFLLPFRIAS